MLWIGQGQWEDSKGVFAAHMQDLPTGHEHFKLRASSQQVHEVRCSCDDVLEVIQHQQHMLLPQCRLQQVQ